jgi:formate-dependent nitrite reductase cytochrome c552 subunit
MRYTLAFVILLVCAVTVHADYKELFEKEFVHKTWVGSRIVEEGVCIDCHTSSQMKEEYLAIPQEWKMSIHYQNGVSCHDCHGGDPADAAVSCGTPHSGFVGTPKYKDVPKMCGKCHIGILKSYNKSGHGKAMMATGEGPNCVTCHHSHNIQKASINIINEVTCKKCHTYDRARTMKQALFMTEKKIDDLDSEIKDLISQGVSAEDEQKMLFRTQAEFRTVFHSINVDLVKARASEFDGKLDTIAGMISDIKDELGFRKNFSAFLFLMFVLLSVVVYLLQKSLQHR